MNNNLINSARVSFIYSRDRPNDLTKAKCMYAYNNAPNSY